jgi:hypothetical protein
MLNISHRMPTSSSKVPSRSSNGRSDELQFGALTEAQLRPYKSVLANIHFLRQYPNDVRDTHDSWLSVRAQDQLEQACKQVDPIHLKAMYKQGLLGPLNKASSLLFELYALTALRTEVITPGLVDDLRKELLPMPGARADKPFEELLKEVGNKLPAEKLEFFQQHISGGPDKKAKDLLSLMVIRFMLSQSSKSKGDFGNQVKNNMARQAADLDETLSWYSPRRLQVWAMTKIYENVSFLPIEWFRSQMQNVVKAQLGVQQIQYEDLIQNLHENQIRAQEILYHHPDLRENALKGMLSGVEVINEAAVVKDAVLGHPSRMSLRA